MTRFKMSKVTIIPGWADIRMTMPRPVPDVPDFQVFDDASRAKMAKTMLAFVSGLAREHGDEVLDEACARLALRLGLLRG